MEQVILPLYIGIISIAVICLLIKPTYVFYIFIGSLPLESLVASDVFSIPKILGILTLISFFVVAIKTRQKIIFDFPFWIFFLLMLWGALSYFWSINTSQTLMSLTTLLQLLIFYFLIINQANDPFSINRIMNSLFVGAIIFSAFGLSDLYLILSKNENARLASIAGNANWYFIVAICLIPAVYWVIAVTKNKILKIIGTLVLAVLFITSLYTQSRGGLISLGIFFLVYFILSRRKASWLLIICLVVALAIQIAPEGYWSRFLMIGSDYTDRLRDLWPAGRQAFAHKPLLGYGLGTSAYIIPEYVVTKSLGVRESVHNSLLAIGIDMGIPGMILYLSFVLLPTAKLYKSIIISNKRGEPSTLLTTGKLLLAVVVAYMASWFKGGGMEYNKMLWLLVGMETVISSRLLSNINPIINLSNVSSKRKTNAIYTY